MGVLTPIIEIATLTVLYAREDLALGRAIALQLIGDDHARHCHPDPPRATGNGARHGS